MAWRRARSQRRSRISPSTSAGPTCSRRCQSQSRFLKTAAADLSPERPACFTGKELQDKRNCCRMSKPLLRAFVITLGLIGPAMAQERILISSDWGKVTAELVDNNATRSLVQMLRSKSATTSVRKRPAIAFALARGRAAARFLDRDAGTLEFQSLCDLL